MFRRFILIVSLISLFSCSTIVVSGNAQLAPQNSVCSKVSEKRVFYLLYGLVPITNNKLDNAIPSDKKVKIETKYTIIDFLIGFAANLIIPTTLYSHTAEIYVCQ